MSSAKPGVVHRPGSYLFRGHPWVAKRGRSAAVKDFQVDKKENGSDTGANPRVSHLKNLGP